MERKRIILIITFLIIIIIGLILYICYDKGMIFSKKEVKENISEKQEEKKDNSENKSDEKIDETEKWEDIALDDPSFYSIYTTLKGFTYEKSRGAGYEDFTNQELANLAFWTAKVQKSDFTEIGIGDFEAIKKSFKADIITGEINKIFNTEVSIDWGKLGSIGLTLTNFDGMDWIDIPGDYETCQLEIKSYDPASNTIIADFTTGCGGAIAPHAKIPKRKIVSAKKYKDVIKVEEKAIYVDGYYSDFDKKTHYFVHSDSTNCNMIDDLEYVINEPNDYQKVNITVDSYLDKASTITHIYKLNPETNQYYFVKSTIS